MSEMPKIIHPKLIKIGGYTFQVVAYCQMNDAQALKIAMHYCRTHKLTKRQKTLVNQIVTIHDESSIGLL
jgi:hypothetical protein